MDANQSPVITETVEVPGNLSDVLYFDLQDDFDRDMDLICFLEVVGYGSCN